MLKNYILVALRNLRKNGTYSFINISGLSVGIACSLLISLWVIDELSFDKFQPKADRLYQVWVNAHFDGKINSWTSVPQPTYEALKTEDNNVVNSAICDWGGDHLFTVGDNRISKKAYYVSEEFLEMFKFPMLRGDASNALDDPTSIVISESMAKILFGDKDPINQTIRSDNANELKVTGVMKDVPKNSSFQFDCLMTWKMKRLTEDWVKNSIDKWDNYSFQVYVELNDPSNEAGVENTIRDLLSRKGQTDIKREFLLHPLLRWRLHSNFAAQDIGDAPVWLFPLAHLITVDYTAEIGKNFRTIKQELLATGVVGSVCKSNSPITEIWSNNFVGWPGKPEELKVIFSTIATEYDYTKTLGIQILEGRDFSEDFKSDTSAIIINKAALAVMGMKNPLGQKLDLWDSKRELIGVVDDVLMGSPYQPVKPMFIVLIPGWASAVSIRLEKTKDLQASIRKVEEVFRKYNPAYPFEYAFADVEFAKKFTTINMISRLASLFASLAIVITGLGLFGLAAFMAEQRTKEIGIRKVMGASVSSLVALMSRDFSKLVLIAFLISSPLAWWVLTDFLERYPYRITIPWWVFPLTGLVALVFATSIVSTQAIRAARANPVNSLRNE